MNVIGRDRGSLRSLQEKKKMRDPYFQPVNLNIAHNDSVHCHRAIKRAAHYFARGGVGWEGE